MTEASATLPRAVMAPVAARRAINHSSFISLCRINILIPPLTIIIPSIWLARFECLPDLRHRPLVRVLLLISDTQ